MFEEASIKKIIEGEPFIYEDLGSLFEPISCNVLYLNVRELRVEHGFDTEVQVLPDGSLKVFPKTIIYEGDEDLEDEE